MIKTTRHLRFVLFSFSIVAIGHLLPLPVAAQAEFHPRMEWKCDGEQQFNGTLVLTEVLVGTERLYAGTTWLSDSPGAPNQLIVDAITRRRRTLAHGSSVGLCFLGFAVKDSRGGSYLMQASVSGGESCGLTVAEGAEISVTGVRILGGPVDANPQFICSARLYLAGTRNTRR